MEKERGARGKVKIRFCRGRTLTVVVVVAAILLSIAALVTLSSAIRSTQEATEHLRGEAGLLEQENSRLERYIEELGTVQAIIRIAQEKLGLVEPDTVIFDTDK